MQQSYKIIQNHTQKKHNNTKSYKNILIHTNHTKSSKETHNTQIIQNHTKNNDHTKSYKI